MGIHKRYQELELTCKELRVALILSEKENQALNSENAKLKEVITELKEQKKEGNEDE